MRRIFFLSFCILCGIVASDDDCKKNEDLIQERLENIKESSRPDTKQVELELTVDGFFLQKFHDNRLDYKDQNPCKDYGLIQPIQISKHNISPNITLMNGVTLRLNGETSPTIVYPNGTVIETKRLEVKAPCTATDHFSPYGNLTCRLIWHNEQYNQNEMFAIWDELVTQKPFAGEVLGESTGNLVVVGIDFDHNVIRLTNGDYDELVLDIKLSESPNRLLLLFYLPSILMVMISWFSMVLGPMAITRAIMIIGSLILLCLHYSMFITPSSNHITAIDVWKIVTLLFVISALLELVIVSCLASTGRSRRFLCCGSKKQKGVNYYTFEPIYEELNDLRNRGTRHTCSCCRYTALCLDLVSVLAFAAGFAIFVFFYIAHNQDMAHYFNDLRLHGLKNHD
uniref:Neurotransmitter-gated ion-channel ligand-binding domain-containing protein n=1 Tax=Acrobeloides nanus TaxID=290746 RepID=A0A914CTJ9_9BILA